MGGWMEEGINRMWSIHTVDYDSDMKRSEALTGYNVDGLEHTMLSKRSRH